MQYEISNRASDIDFECDRDGTKRILQNAHNLLMTQIGEVPFDRMRGFYSGLYDLPIPEINQLLLPMLDALFSYEPRVNAVSAEASIGSDGLVYITCVIEIKEDE